MKAWNYWAIPFGVGPWRCSLFVGQQRAYAVVYAKATGAAKWRANGPCEWCIQVWKVRKISKSEAPLRIWNIFVIFGIFFEYL